MSHGLFAMAERFVEMAIINIVSIGKFKTPSTKPYYVGLKILPDKPPFLQTMGEAQFFALVTGLIQSQTCPCGREHVRTVTIPDEEIERFRKQQEQGDSKIIL